MSHVASLDRRPSLALCKMSVSYQGPFSWNGTSPLADVVRANGTCYDTFLRCWVPELALCTTASSPSS